MLPTSVAALLVGDRQKTYRADADAARLAKLVRTPGRFDRPRFDSALRNLARVRHGMAVRFRPIRSDDTVLLHDMFARLSTQSRRQRFLSSKNQLSAAEVRYFTHLNHYDHEALVAVSRVDGRGLGVARYVRSTVDSEVAEVAVTVVDDWQGQGLGTALVRRLAVKARCAGIHRFSATMLTDNVGAHRLLHAVGGQVSLVERDGATSSFEVALPPSAAERRATRWYVLGPATTGCAGT